MMRKILFAVALAGVGCGSDVELEVDAEPASKPDAGQSDAGSADAGSPDAHAPDAARPDATVCGNIGEACCEGECDAPFECNPTFPGGNLQCTPPCGGENERCCEDTRPSNCNEGFSCKISADGGEVCVTACFGDHPGYCPSGEDCVYLVNSERYVCAACGEAGQPCCDGVCNPGNVCSGICTVAP